MSSVLDREALSGSPLADLHIIASELGLDGFRRLRKADLVDAILERQDGAATTPVPDADADTETADTDVAGDDDDQPKRRRRTRGGRGRRRNADPGDEATSDDAEPDAPAGEVAAEPATTADADEEDEAPTPRRRRGGRNRGARDADTTPAAAEPAPAAAEPAATQEAPAADASGGEAVEGTLEVLGNGSGFVRLSPPEPSDGDVYVSAAQIRRCELVSGDRVVGPVRPPRRSERYPSLVRVETINGQPADEVAERTRWEDLPAAFPSERLKLGAEDETLKAIEFLTPFGRGSRVVVAGPSRAGKTEALRRIGAALAGQDDLEVAVVLAGVRPEETTEWEGGPVAVAASVTFAGSPDARAQAVERGVDQAKRAAARGGHAVLLVDGLDGLPPGAARKALAAARAIPDAGSLTLIATAETPQGGETTVVALDVALTSTRRFPALDLPASGTLRPELLVGEEGASAIARARADTLGV
jgi:transcription termination factor Rho